MNSLLTNKFFKVGLFVFLISLAFTGGVLFNRVENLSSGSAVADKEVEVDPETVIPEKGFELPISWGDWGPKLIELGVIDKEKFFETVNMSSDEEKILTQGTDKKIVINADNSQFVVDLLWAIGLAQKSLAYEEGPMGQEYKKDVGNFSSTGGWTLSSGKATDYLGKYDFLNLNPDQQLRVKNIAENVFRPCCGNSTWFPDCNHGMAALAAIEMMVGENLSDDEIYKSVLKLNSFWFQSTYLTTAKYFQKFEGKSWNEVDPKLILSAEYSSSRGAANIARRVDPVPASGGGGCGA